MALSDWDTMAFDSDGKPCNGIIEGFLEGTNAEIYKNWLYIRDAKMWCEERGYMKPTIAEIFEGCISISDFDIRAVRGPQRAIFVSIKCIRYHEQKKDEEYREPDIRRMAGIGCDGYTDPCIIMMKELDLDADKWESWGWGHSSEGTYSLCVMNRETEKLEHFNFPNDSKYEPEWIGVTDETYRAFIDWLKSFDDDDDDYRKWISKIEASKGVRFNQGDAFFANRLGFDVPATEIAAAEKPILQQAFEKQDEEDEEKP